jgi:tellurite resistance protein
VWASVFKSAILPLVDARDLAIVKGLSAVAWADGKVNDQEMAVVEALLEAYRATPSEIHEVKRFAATKRSLEDIELNELGIDDRRVLLHHAVLLTFADGEPHPDELRLVRDLATELRLAPLDAARVVQSAEAHARALVG